MQFLDGDYRGYQAAWLRYRNGELVLYLATNVSGGEGWPTDHSEAVRGDCWLLAVIARATKDSQRAGLSSVM